MKFASLLFALTALSVMAAPSQAKSPPHQAPWVYAAVEKAITSYRTDSGARPVREWYLAYPHKIAVVIEFDRAVRAPLVGAGGRVIRFSFDLVTHVENGELRFCDVYGDQPPLARCLAR